ncbi:MAG TPA: IclR family transcriptional regulator [Chloroflexota bacterium]|nr:IclR family transcriptional regulator [Chloroflexota bacterium]
MPGPAVAPTQPATAHLVPAVDRAVRILHLLRGEARLWGISELARTLGLNKATVRDILLTLEHHGLVERDAATTRFRLGYGLYAFAGALRDGTDLVAVARPFLRALAERTGETSLLALLDGDRVLILDKEEPPTDLKISAPIGRRLPLYAGSIGKVLLAAMEPAARDRWLAEHPPRRFTARSVTDPAAYRAMLVAVARQGYALDDEEYLDGVRAASAPIRGSAPGAVAALTVVGFSTRISEERLAELAAAVADAARQISWRLGAAPAATAPNGRANGHNEGQGA